MLYILIDDIVKAKFFNCFSENKDVVFITNKVSCYFYLKCNAGTRILFLTEPKQTQDDNVTGVNIERLSKTIAVLNERQTLNDAIRNYVLVKSSLSEKFQNINISTKDIVILFNGNHATAIATADFFSSAGAKLLYAEISNLPDKMIFDPKGVNAQSLLYSKPEVLDALEPVSVAQHEQWVKDYIRYKEKPIPQSNINIPTYIMLAIDDMFARVFENIIKEDSLSFFDKVRMFHGKFKSRKILSAAEHYNLNEDYIFFPTQVTSDTQLRINSDIDNISAINMVLELEKNIDIYVKIHPAESNIDTINYFIKLAEEKKIKLVSNNTVELIKNAKKIYTINSTVGLEALIFEKDLAVLGRAIYSNFDSLRLRQYIHRYLMDLDYFGNNKLTNHHFDKLSRLSEL
ncbi:hypothetical protein ACN0IV_06390 [Trabulsiella odontotermitis]|uniref:capsular polysaccharide export protein, LipB/KpsS family n=1 Tax=Trabulsiella odontotermitis TaxID=379893 RepID=UPI003AD174A8